MGYPKLQINFLRFTNKELFLSLVIVIVPCLYAISDVLDLKTISNFLILFLSLGFLFALNNYKISLFRSKSILLAFIIAGILSLPNQSRLYVSIIPLTSLLFINKLPSFSKHFAENFKYIVLFSSLLSFALFTNQVEYLQSEARFTTSDNGNSVCLIFLLFAELLITSRVSFSLLPSVVLSFLFLGNRSSAFLLFAMPFPLNPVILGLFCLLCLLLSYGVITFDFLLNNPYFTNRIETGNALIFNIRYQYFLEFINNRPLETLFMTDPEIMNIYHHLMPGEINANPHNSFIDFFLRDKFIGLINLAIWITSMITIKFNIWAAVTSRACYDTFFMVGPMFVIPNYYIYYKFCLLITRLRNRI